MKKIVPILLLIFCAPYGFAQDAKDALLARDVDVLIEELRFMHALDQGVRKYLSYETFSKEITDSIENLQKEEIELAEASLSLSEASRTEIWDNIISPLDSLKAVRLIAIIEKYGYPSTRRLEKHSGQDLDFTARTILVHTPLSFKNVLLPILEREYAAGNLQDQCEYGYLLWHIHGRSDFSYMLNNGYEMKRNSDGTFALTSNCE